MKNTAACTLVLQIQAVIVVARPCHAVVATVSPLPPPSALYGRVTGPPTRHEFPRAPPTARTAGRPPPERAPQSEVIRAKTHKMEDRPSAESEVIRGTVLEGIDNCWMGCAG